VLVVTGLRLKALHLAVSSDLTYSKSYLGLLSAVGCMLSIVLCGTLAMHGMYVKAKRKLIDCNILSDTKLKVRARMDLTMVNYRGFWSSQNRVRKTQIETGLEHPETLWSRS